MSTRLKQGAKKAENIVADRIQAAYVGGVISIGLLIALVTVILETQGSPVPSLIDNQFSEAFVVATIIYGAIEVPRIRNVSETARSMIALILILTAFSFATIFHGSQVRDAALVSLVVLFITSIAIRLFTPQDVPTGNISQTLKREGPAYAAFGGIVLISVVM